MGKKTKHLSINSSMLLLLGNLAWTQCLASSYRPRSIHRALSQMIHSNRKTTDEKILIPLKPLKETWDEPRAQLQTKICDLVGPQCRRDIGLKRACSPLDYPFI
eukprot:TRINITY_DN11626_c0_g2_i1.p1 TRINITY_DN11626_c0_g2~~TRINITY_DN11626_c0_g2_i1.p1  ORF type:complete len:104 (-),score=5.03 TRINITY_DN11626_c0_g2_i1:530-841(-)